MHHLLRLLAPFATLCGAAWRHPWWAAFALAVLVGTGVGGAYGVRQHRARSYQRDALAALERWDFARAHADLAYCVDVWPDDAATRFLAAQAARRAGLFDEADEHLARAERAGYNRERIALEWALLRAERGEVRAVEGPLLSRVAQDDLDTPLILEALALGYVHVYRLPDAGRCLDLLLQRQPRNVFALKWRGLCLEGIGVQEKAVEDFRKAVAIDPDYDDARRLLADRLSVRLKRYPEALEHFEVLHQRHPDDSGVTIGLARCRRLMGEGDQARQLLEEVLRAAPEHLGALAERGQLALDENRPADAACDLRRAADAVAAPDRQVLHGLERALRQLGKTEEAAAVHARGQRMDQDVKDFTEVLKAIGAHPQDAALYCRAAAICRRNGQDAEELRWLQGALSRDPNHGPAHAALAEYYERHADPDAAERHRRLAAPAKG